MHFELTDADYKETLRALEAATNSFLSPVTDELIFVANDTTQKRTEYERTAAVVVPFSETETVQELQEIATSVRGVLDMQRLMVDNQRKLILMRDRVPKVRLAEKVLQDLLRSRAQVEVEVRTHHHGFVLFAELRHLPANGLPAGEFRQQSQLAERHSGRLQQLPLLRRRGQPDRPGHHQRAAVRDGQQIQ